jgi:hypothetical protein
VAIAHIYQGRQMPPPQRLRTERRATTKLEEPAPQILNS